MKTTIDLFSFCLLYVTLQIATVQMACAHRRGGGNHRSHRFPPYGGYGGQGGLPAPPLTGNRARVHPFLAGTFIFEGVGLDGASSSTLVRTPMTTLLADSGMAYDNRKILEGLQRLRIPPSAVDINVISHGHPDHQGNTGLFTSGTIHLSESAFFKYTQLCFHTLGDTPPGTAWSLDDWITIVSTGGGDTVASISVVVENADVYNEQNQIVFPGTVAMVGDLLFTPQDFQGGSFSTANSPDPAIKFQSLAALMCPNGANVGYIIPGHGEGFQVTDAMRNSLDCGGVNYQPGTVTITPNWRQDKRPFTCDMISYS